MASFSTKMAQIYQEFIDKVKTFFHEEHLKRFIQKKYFVESHKLHPFRRLALHARLAVTPKELDDKLRQQFGNSTPYLPITYRIHRLEQFELDKRAMETALLSSKRPTNVVVRKDRPRPDDILYLPTNNSSHVPDKKISDSHRHRDCIVDKIEDIIEDVDVVGLSGARQLNFNHDNDRTYNDTTTHTSHSSHDSGGSSSCSGSSSSSSSDSSSGGGGCD